MIIKIYVINHTPFSFFLFYLKFILKSFLFGSGSISRGLKLCKTFHKYYGVYLIISDGSVCTQH